MSAQLERLRLLLQPLCRQGLCLAFSGGVDSTVVLAAAVSIPTEKPVQAVLFATQLLPPAEEKEAEKLCREMGIVKKGPKRQSDEAFCRCQHDA